LFADGYVEAEVTTPEVKELKNITGLAVKMRKTADGTKTVLPKQFLSGAVTRDGRPVKTGWVGLWHVRKNLDAVNAPVLRGRVVDGLPFYLQSAPIVNGNYRLQIPDDDEYLVVAEEPGRPPTQVGPIGVKLRQERKLDIACVKGGSISGKVNDPPKGWEGHLWVIAFTKTGMRFEGRTKADGTFQLEGLPPGAYGLKVGHDGYLDTEVPQGRENILKGLKQLPDAWKNARVVRVESERVTADVMLTLPPGGELAK
jgi:hypothetical protein